MGEFLLAMAQERAAKEGLQAEALVKHGEFADALAVAIQELDADVVVLGSPGQETAILTRGYLAKLGETLTKDSDLEILMLRDGEIVHRYAGESDD